MRLDQQGALNPIVVRYGNKKKRDEDRPVLKLYLHLQSQLPILLIVAEFTLVGQVGSSLVFSPRTSRSSTKSLAAKNPA